MKNKNTFVILFYFSLISFLVFTGCPNGDDHDQKKNDVELSRLEPQPPREVSSVLFSTTNGFPAEMSNSWKIWGNKNPLFTQAFGADPNILIYEDRLYLYMSNDTIQYNSAGGFLTPATDPEGHGPSYLRGIQGIRIVSTSDMANWTDHGAFNIVGTPNTNPLISAEYWQPAGRFYLPDNSPVERSWAPTAAWSMMGRRPRFFLYWCDGGNGVGVVVSDTPTGPWTSATGNRLLVDRSTPNSADVLWLFDPSVFIDSDGQGYLFLGGGWDPGNHPQVPANNTGMARRVKLGPDMVSLAGEPEQWHVPYLFEASEMKKIRGRYYFSYSTHYSMSGNPYGLGNRDIAYMMSETNPMAPYPGGFTSPARVLTAPATQFGSTDTNNHHAMFEFRGETYITYHTQLVSMAMGVYPELSNRRLRSAFIDRMPVNPDGTIPPITMTRSGVEQISYLNPFIENEAETIAVQGGVYTRPATGASNGMLVTSIDTGDWLGIYGVDFGSVGAKRFTARVRTPDMQDYVGAIELRLNPQAAGETRDIINLSPTVTTRITGGEVIGVAVIQALPGEEGKFAKVSINLDKTVTGVHDLVFVFYSSLGIRPETVLPDSRHKDGFEFDTWQFFSD